MGNIETSSTRPVGLPKKEGPVHGETIPFKFPTNSLTEDVSVVPGEPVWSFHHNFRAREQDNSTARSARMTAAPRGEPQ